jgi:hypothetical protein
LEESINNRGETAIIEFGKNSPRFVSWKVGNDIAGGIRELTGSGPKSIPHREPNSAHQAKPRPYGASDEIGFKAAENRVSINDFHATVLHLLGLDHKKLTYRYNGRDFRLSRSRQERWDAISTLQQQQPPPRSWA